MEINLTSICDPNPTPKDRQMIRKVVYKIFLDYNLDAANRKLCGSVRNRVYLLEDGVFDGPWCIKLVSRVKPYIIPNRIKFVIQRDKGVYLVETTMVSLMLKFVVSLVDDQGEVVSTHTGSTLARALRSASSRRSGFENMFYVNQRIFTTIYSTIERYYADEHADPSLVECVKEYLAYNKKQPDQHLLLPRVRKSRRRVNPIVDIEPCVVSDTEDDIPPVDLPDIYIPCFDPYTANRKEIINTLIN